MAKYKMTSNQKSVTNTSKDSYILTQVEAIDTFTTIDGTLIKAGSLGGWIETESNLSQEGKCWLDSKSTSVDRSQIKENAYLQDSNLFDDAIATGDVYLNYSFLSDSSVVCGKSKVYFSHIKKDSLLDGNSEVIESSLTNVRVVVGTNDTTKWGSFYFRDVDVEIESGGCEILADCRWQNVELSAKRLILSAPSELLFVDALDISELVVEQTLVMKYVYIHPESIVEVYEYDRNKKKTEMYGMTGLEVANWVQLDTPRLPITGTQVKGNVSIKGRWSLVDSHLSGYTTLINHSSLAHILEGSSLIELANVSCLDSHTHGSVIKDLMLQGDMKYMIA